MLSLSYYSAGKGLQRKIYNKELEQLNRKGCLMSHLMLTTEEVVLTEARAQRHFSSINDLSLKIEQQPQNAFLYFARSIDDYLVQDFEKALADVHRSIELDSTNVFAYFLRAQIILKNMAVREAEKRTSDTEKDKWNYKVSQVDLQQALSDCDKVLAIVPDFSGCHYNKGYAYMQMGEWKEAVAAYTRAIQLHPDFAEAYYNRGIAYIQSGEIKLGVADLSVAGEKGLYGAYNLIKRYRKHE
jgi:tetratricopeptide (TPR) repeat protein